MFHLGIVVTGLSLIGYTIIAIVKLARKATNSPAPRPAPLTDEQKAKNAAWVAAHNEEVRQRREGSSRVRDAGIEIPGSARCQECGGACKLGISGWYHVWPNGRRMRVCHPAVVRMGGLRGTAGQDDEKRNGTNALTRHAKRRDSSTTLSQELRSFAPEALSGAERQPRHPDAVPPRR